MADFRWPAFLTGQVVLEVTGERISPFVDAMLQAGISVEHMYWVEQGKIRFTVPLKHLFAVVRLAKQHGLKGKMRKRSGMPFLMKKVRKRKFFYIGFLAFVFLLFFLSSFVWTIEIEGANAIPEKQILQLLREEGIYSGQLKVRLPEPEKIQQDLLAKMPLATWVGVRLEGTRLIVTVAEKKQANQQKQEESGGPVNLVAKKDAFIYDMLVERGNPLVEVNQMVKKGQILVSGIYGSPGQEGGQKVGAKGIVLGEVWYESEVVVPLIQKQKEFTGNREKQSAIFIGSLTLKNPFADPPPFAKYETNKEVVPLQIGKWQFPIGMIYEENLETQEKQKKLTVQDAILLGKRHASEELKQMIGKHGKILEEKVLHRTVENGKVYLKIHFQVVENIAIEQPIL